MELGILTSPATSIMMATSITDAALPLPVRYCFLLTASLLGMYYQSRLETEWWAERGSGRVCAASERVWGLNN